ncbi:hypothetical protein AA313_de0205827 [Arthrobotrys entomopaga]|nr:hypothetical protein AA313_de0205827 [Arthrobotrys entomopaga]
MSSPLPPLQTTSEEPEDLDIDELQKQVNELTKIRNAQQEKLLSFRSTQTLRQVLESSQTIKTSISDSNSNSDSNAFEIEDENLNSILLKRAADITADKHQWSQESLYRMAGLTSFQVQDPSPNGALLTGVRIEVMADGKFGTPYYLFLKPYDDTTTPKSLPSAAPLPDKFTLPSHLTLHRHTIPAYFLQTLNALAEKHLPPPPRPQNLDRLVRDMRRILLLHYLRTTHLNHIKAQVIQHLPQNHPNPTEIPEIYISEFTFDPEARLIELEWLDTVQFGVKRLGWVAVTEEGGVEGVIVKQDGKRVLEMEMKIKGDWVRGEADSMDWIDGLFERCEWIGQ